VTGLNIIVIEQIVSPSTLAGLYWRQFLVIAAVPGHIYLFYGSLAGGGSSALGSETHTAVRI
jgi:hypothetical protein